jgi:hypothetical protein
MPPCLAAATRPIQRFSPPLVTRVGASGARYARRARHLPGRTKTGAGGGDVRAPLVLVSSPARLSKPAAGGGGARAPPLVAGSSIDGWNRSAPVFPSPMLHMYVSIVSGVSDVCCNCSILML